MSRYVRVATPENVDIDYELAGIGSRSLAALLDHLLQAALLAGPALGMESLGIAPWQTGSLWVQALLTLLVFAALFGYFVGFEILWAGRTPGKRALGLRVVRDGGYPIDPYSSAVRNLVRIVDIVPPVYGSGLTSIFLSAEYKRLGDWAAGTLVIKERGPARVESAIAPPSPAVAALMALIESVEGLKSADYQALRRFRARRAELDPHVQAHIAARLAHRLRPRLGVEAARLQGTAVDADVLEAIERRYGEEHGLA